MFNFDKEAYIKVVYNFDDSMFDLLLLIKNKDLDILDLTSENKTLIANGFYKFYKKLFGKNYAERYKESIDNPIMYVINILNFLYIERYNYLLEKKEFLVSDKDIDLIINDILIKTKDLGVNDSMIFAFQIEKTINTNLNSFV